MIFIIGKEDLMHAIGPTSLALTGKWSEGDNGIYMEAKQDSIIFYSYDLEKGIRTTIQAQVEQEGSILVGPQIIPMIQSLPAGNVTIRSDEEFGISLSSGSATFAIQGKSAENYNRMPEIRGDVSFSLAQNKLREMIGKSIFAVSDDDSRPIYTGSLFEIHGNEMTVVALNGNRIAVQKETGVTENQDLDLRFIVPAKAQQNLLRLTSDTDQPIGVELTKKHIIFTLDNIYFLTRLLEGDFMDYRKKVPENMTTTVKIDREAFIDSLERASLVIDKNRHSVKCSFEGQTLTVSCATESGRVQDILPADIEGEAVEIGFNHLYVLEALKASDGQFVTLKLIGKLGPMLVLPDEKQDGRDSLHMILPVKMRD